MIKNIIYAGSIGYFVGEYISTNYGSPIFIHWQLYVITLGIILSANLLDYIFKKGGEQWKS